MTISITTTGAKSTGRAFRTTRTAPWSKSSIFVVGSKVYEQALPILVGLRKSHALVTLLVFVSLATASHWSYSSASSDAQPVSTTLIALTSNPGLFNGKVVQVEGTVSQYFCRTAGIQFVNGTAAVNIDPETSDLLTKDIGKSGELLGRFTYADGSSTIEAQSFRPDPSSGGMTDWYATGSPNLLVIPVYFSDKSNSKTVADVANTAVQMKNYYLENSFNKLNFNIYYVTSWSMMPQSYSYYGTDSHFWEYLNAAIGLVDPSVNFNDYKFVVVVHAGGDEAMTGNPGDIWSMAYQGGMIFLTNDGTVQLGVSTVSEFDPMGTFAHEVGHELGLPDLYDYNHLQTFVGSWDLMDSGSWNGFPPGTSPAHFTSYGKIQAGWLSVTNILAYSIGEDITATLYPLEDLTSFYQVIKIQLSSSTYYLVEVRQQTGYDGALPGHGVLVLYVDETLTSGQGIVRVKNPSLTAFGVGAHYQDNARNMQIDVVSSAGSGYTIHVGSVAPLMDAYFTSIKVTNGNSFLEMISGGIAKVYSYQSPVWFNLTFYNSAAGLLGANLFTQFAYTTASGYSWAGNSSTQYVLRYTSNQVNWWASAGLPGPDTYYITVKLYFDDGGILKLEDQKDITLSIVYLAVGNWSAYAHSLPKGSSTDLGIVFGNAGNDQMYDVSVQVADTAGLIISPLSVSVGTLLPSEMRSASFTVTAPASFSVGTYSVKLKVSYYDFRGVYHEEYFYCPITVTKMTTSLIMTSGSSVKIGQVFSIYGQLRDGNGNPLAGQTVGLFVNNSLLFYLTTNSTGFVRADLNFTQAGTYEFNLTYDGTGEYLGSSSSLRYEVQPVILTVTTGLATQQLIYIDGSLLMSSGSGTYILIVGTYGEQHNLTAVDAVYPTAGTRYVFMRWFDSALNSTTTSRTLIITVTADRSIDVIWQLQYLMQVVSLYSSTSGSGWYVAGQDATVSVADSIVDISSGVRQVFRGWSSSSIGGYNGNSTQFTLTMNQPVTETANWMRQFRLTVVQGQGTGWYDEGTLVVYTANYVNSSDIQGTRSRLANCIIDGIDTRAVPVGNSGFYNGTAVMSSPHNVVMTYVQQFLVTLVADNNNGVALLEGSITNDGWFDSGSVATLQVVSPVTIVDGRERIVALGWGGSFTSDQLNTTVVVSGPMNIVSKWKTQYFVSINPGIGQVDKSSQWADKGSSVVVRATDPSNFMANSSKLVFKGWTGTATSTDNPLTIVILSYQEITATWQQMYYLTVISSLGSPSGEGWYASGSVAVAGVTTPLGFLVQQVFDHWEGASTSTSSTTTVMMDAPKTVVAVWRNEYTQLIALIGGISIAAAGAGVYLLKFGRRTPRLEPRGNSP